MRSPCTGQASTKTRCIIRKHGNFHVAGARKVASPVPFGSSRGLVVAGGDSPCLLHLRFVHDGKMWAGTRATSVHVMDKTRTR